VNIHKTYLEQIQQELKQTPAEYLPVLLSIIHAFRESVCINSAEENFRNGWQEMQQGHYEPLPVEHGLLTVFGEKVSPSPVMDKPPTQANFQDLCGILTAQHGASLEDMEQAILKRTQERFNDCN
jgi:hypothetical protein